MPETASPTAIPVTLRQPRHQLSHRVIALWTWRAAIMWSLVTMPQVIALIFLVTRWQIIGLAATAVVGAAQILVIPQWRYRIHRWEPTPEAVYTLEGWITRHWQIAPVSRIQTVDTEQGPLERWLRLTTVTITTASAHGAIHIKGLDRDVANRLAGKLTRITHATPGDAT